MRFLVSLGVPRLGGDVTEVLREILVLVVLGDDEGVFRVLVAAVLGALACPVVVAMLGVDSVLRLGLVPGHQALPDDQAQWLLLRLVLAGILSLLIMILIRVDWTPVGGTFIAAFGESYK